MGPIAKSVILHRVGKSCHGQTLLFIGPIHKLRKNGKLRIRLQCSQDFLQTSYGLSMDKGGHVTRIILTYLS